MSTTVTLRLSDNVYHRFKTLAAYERRTLSNFIETSALHYIDEHLFVDEFEMSEILTNKELNKSIKRARKDVQERQGRFVA